MDVSTGQGCKLWPRQHVTSTYMKNSLRLKVWSHHTSVLFAQSPIHFYWSLHKGRIQARMSCIFVIFSRLWHICSNRNNSGYLGAVSPQRYSRCRTSLPIQKGMEVELIEKLKICILSYLLTPGSVKCACLSANILQTLFDNLKSTFL